MILYKTNDSQGESNIIFTRKSQRTSQHGNKTIKPYNMNLTILKQMLGVIILNELLQSNCFKPSKSIKLTIADVEIIPNN